MSPIIEITPSICSASSTSSGRWSLISAYVRKPRSLPSTIRVFRRRLRASTSAGVSSRGAISACLPFLPFLLAAASSARLPAIFAAISLGVVGLCARRRRAACRRGCALAGGCRGTGARLRPCTATGLAAAWPGASPAALATPPCRQRPWRRAWRRASAGAASRERLRAGRLAASPCGFAAGSCLAAGFFLAALARRFFRRGFFGGDLARRLRSGRFFADAFAPARASPLLRARRLAPCLGRDLRAGLAGFLAMVILVDSRRSCAVAVARGTADADNCASTQYGGDAGKPQIISSRLMRSAASDALRVSRFSRPGAAGRSAGRTKSSCAQALGLLGA